MAVSGRKLSLSLGSAEDVGYCDPCLTTGQHVDALKYCVDCGEFLCRNCSECHLKTKASRNHQLVGKDNVGKQHTIKDSEVCTELCPEHKQEVIKYFCPQHDNIGCHICMMMSHKTCEVDYIPNKCAHIANSEEYRRVVYRLDLKLQELNEIMQTTKVREQEIDKCHHNLLQEINKFRKEINDSLDQLQQKIQNKVDKKKTEDKQITQYILDGCNSLSLDIKKIQSNMQAYETSGKYGQLYIAVKQAQSVLISDEIKADDGLERTAQQYIYECDNSLLNLVSEQATLGKLSLQSFLKTPKRYMKTFKKLTKKEEIDIWTKNEASSFFITGSAVLFSKELVLADRNNKKIKLLNMYTRTLIREQLLYTLPWDVTVLSQDKIAVTMPEEKTILLMKMSDDRLSAVHTISVTGQCYGITYHYGHLYVVCKDPLGVLVLDKQGNVKNNISLDKDIFTDPTYLVVSEDCQLLYISDYDKHCVVSITSPGKVTAVYKHKDLKGPRGMLMLDDGSLLVCCYNGTIHHISGDLKQCRTVTDGLIKNQFTMSYNHHLHEVYASSCGVLLSVLIPE